MLFVEDLWLRILDRATTVTYGALSDLEHSQGTLYLILADPEPYETQEMDRSNQNR